MKFNSSHINKQVIHKIVRAARIALQRGTVEHVRNKKGNAYLAVRLVKDWKGRTCFKVTDKEGNNIKQTLLMTNLKSKGLIFGGGVERFITNNLLWNYQAR